MFEVYFNLGFEHILDWEGYDHMLFLLAICIPYTLKDWKKVLILATAFTIGHSVTLALSTLDVVRFPMNWIEFLIPITIILAGVYDIFYAKNKSLRIHYILAFVFGLIHGMGFSNFLRSSLLPGEESQLLWQLLYFNIGIEMGQVIIVLVLLSVLWVVAQMTKKWKWKKIPVYQYVLGTMVILWSAYMAFERIPIG